MTETSSNIGLSNAGTDGIFHELKRASAAVVGLHSFFFFFSAKRVFYPRHCFTGETLGWEHVREHGRYDFLRPRQGKVETQRQMVLNKSIPISFHPSPFSFHVHPSPYKSILSFPSSHPSFRFGNTPCLFSGICYVYYAISRFPNKLFN